MTKKMLALLCAVLLMMVMVTACGGSPDSGVPGGSSNNGGSSNDGGSPNDDVSNDGSFGDDGDDDGLFGTASDNVIYVGSRTGSISTQGVNAYVYRGDNEKYGIRSMDGKQDTGAIYLDVDVIAKDYFTVRTNTYEDPSNLAAVNSTGVADATGKLLIPAQYALIKSIDGRFFTVYTVTAQTEDKDKCLVRLSSSIFSLTIQEGDVLYTGYWEVYDIQTGAKVPNVTDTESPSVSVNGDVLSFRQDGNQMSYNVAGQKLPDNIRLFEDGSYYIYGENVMYDSANNVRFTIADDGFTPYNWSQGYYVMRAFEGSSRNYALADNSGQICSAVFNNPQSFYVLEGGLVGTCDGVYDLQGNKVLSLESTYYNSYYYKGCWLVRDENKNVYLIDNQYNTAKIGTLSDTVMLDSWNFTVRKEEGDVKYFYCIAQKAFVEGTDVALGLAEKKVSDQEMVLIDMMTGEQLLSGYSRYTIVESSDNVRYIYAQGRTDNYETIYDMFILK